MKIEETEHGMRIDTFLVDSDMRSEEILEPRRTVKREKEICKKIVSVLNQKNRLPDSE